MTESAAGPSNVVAAALRSKSKVSSSRPASSSTSRSRSNTASRLPGGDHLDDVIARLTARRVANPPPPVGATPVKHAGRARKQAMERRLMDAELLSDAGFVGMPEPPELRRLRAEVKNVMHAYNIETCDLYL